MSKRIPVTILSGFLGSGKTTIIRKILQEGNNKLAVMINEFGNVGIDGDLIRTCGMCPEEEIEGRLVELNNGCLCCTVQDDFLPVMESLLSQKYLLDGILIETSGLALPEPLIQALEWPEIRSKVVINGLVTIVDGEAYSKGSPVSDLSLIEEQRANDDNLDHITSINELFTDQLKYADLVLVSKSDKISSNCFNNINKLLLQKVRKNTPILPMGIEDIPSSIILGIGNTQLSMTTESNLISNQEHLHEHKHLQVSSGCIRLDINLNRSLLESRLPKLSKKYNILRLKGRLWLKDKELPLQVQMVGPRINFWFERAPRNSWRPEDSGIELVVLSLDSMATEKIEQELMEVALD